MLSNYAVKEWLTIAATGVLLAIAAIVAGWWPLVVVLVLVTVALLAFYRDPPRRTPSQRGAIVAPADGRVSSIHEVEHFEPFRGPALCIRIFLSVLDVHVNRSPCHGRVAHLAHTPGKHLNALNPQSAEDNESNLMVLAHPIKGHPIAAVRQVAGLLARTIHCAAKADDTLQRGQKFGIIKLGSTTEVYLPLAMNPRPSVEQGQRVVGGVTVVANVISTDHAEPPRAATATVMS